MTSTLWPALVGLAGMLAGVAATYVATKRRSSGKIATSEAADVWKGMADLFAASESIRHDLAARVVSLEARQNALEADNAALRAQLAALCKRLEG